jgi:hypothetical protein
MTFTDRDLYEFDQNEDDRAESYEYVCNTCNCSEILRSYRGSYVCPWCGEGVMSLEV